MHLAARRPFVAVAAAVLALGAAGFAAAGSSTFRSHSRPSVTPPPCERAHGRCDDDGDHGKGGGDHHGKGGGDDHHGGRGGGGGHDRRK
jgi:hypothetical protein